MSFSYDSGLWLATRKIWVRFGRWMCSSMVRVGHHVPLGIWSLIRRLPSCGFTASSAAPPAPPHLLLQFLCVPSQVCVQQSSKKHQHFLQITVSSSLEMVRDRYGERQIFSNLSSSLASHPLTVCITINCGKFWKRWEYQTTWPASWEICMQVRKQQLELDMEQQTGSK